MKENVGDEESQHLNTGWIFSEVIFSGYISPEPAPSTHGGGIEQIVTKLKKTHLIQQRRSFCGCKSPVVTYNNCVSQWLGSIAVAIYRISV